MGTSVFEEIAERNVAKVEERVRGALRFPIDAPEGAWDVWVFVEAINAAVALIAATGDTAEIRAAVASRGILPDTHAWLLTSATSIGVANLLPLALESIARLKTSTHWSDQMWPTPEQEREWAEEFDELTRLLAEGAQAQP